ncbi:MAG TPA: nucleotidyltransferase family protein [Vineibacter sp.]|nr:nucleotidyltransferase family protein [Vineibacter sp.]
MSPLSLEAIVRSHPLLSVVLDRGKAWALPDAWLVAGAVAQGVWNARTGRDPAHGIRDIDIVYFDAADLSAETEAAHEARLRDLLADVPAKLDVKNEARVHLWYRDVFGYGIDPYRSTEDAIATFPTTATSIGVRLDGGALRVCAPFGVDDLMTGIVRSNKRQITQAVYDKKVARWRTLWPELTYLPWDHTQPPSTT